MKHSENYSAAGVLCSILATALLVAALAIGGLFGFLAWFGLVALALVLALCACAGRTLPSLPAKHAKRREMATATTVVGVLAFCLLPSAFCLA